MRQRKAQSEWEQNRPKTKMELEQEHHQKIEEQRLLEEKEKVFFFLEFFIQIIYTVDIILVDVIPGVTQI